MIFQMPIILILANDFSNSNDLASVANDFSNASDLASFIFLSAFLLFHFDVWLFQYLSLFYSWLHNEEIRSKAYSFTLEKSANFIYILKLHFLEFIFCLCKFLQQIQSTISL